MKKLFLLLCAAVVCGISGCAAFATEKTCTSATERPLKTGFFVDRGSSGGGVLHIARLLFHSPQIEVTLLDGKDIRNGKLDTLDLLVVPGGSSATQFKMMKAEGAAKIREFVHNGGNYVGVCAGFHCTLNRPDRIALLPYVYLHNTAGAQAPLTVNISDEGAKILGIKPGDHRFHYSAGPLAAPGEPWEHGTAKVLATYRSSVSKAGRKPFDFAGKPAILLGNYGKGQVIASSFHPEYTVANYPVFNGMVKAVSGREITQNFPQKVYRPIRVAFHAATVSGKERIHRLLELDRHQELDVTIVANTTICDGALDHADVLVIMSDNIKSFRKFVENNEYLFRNFLDRGGRIITTGEVRTVFKPHPNLVEVPAGTSFVDAVLKRR